VQYGFAKRREQGGAEVILGVNHVQVNVAPEDLAKARDFYVDFMGMRQIPRPATFKSKGIWLNAGMFELHIGVEEDVDRSKTRAHVAYQVADLNCWREKVGQAGAEMTEQPLIAGYDRFQFRDPFGNMVEVIQRL
jgi:catechol 2,3-dioxygenase-like lactoylglutathione lyase family enzyme